LNYQRQSPDLFNEGVQLGMMAAAQKMVNVYDLQAQAV
jgi:hypothetical protein